MSYEESLRQAARLNHAGVSYADLLKQRGAADLVARPSLVRRIAGLLGQGENVLLVGRPGSGRRSLVRLALHRLLAADSKALDQDLAALILALMDDKPEPQHAADAGPPCSPILDIVEVPVPSFEVNAVYVGELETKVAGLIDNARKAKAALFVPDLHLTCRAGASVQNPQRTLAALLGPPMGQGELRLVGSTTPQGVQALRYQQPGFLAAFVPVEVPEADEAEAERMLAAVGERLPHGVRLGPEAVGEAVRLSRRSHAGQALPGRAFALVRETAARLRGDGAPDGTVVQAADLLETYRLRAGLRPEFVHADHRLQRSDVEHHLSSRVVAQPEAVSAVARLVVAFKAGLVSTEKPIGTLLFAGPTGVGKTHLAQCLAEYLFGSRARLLRFDMGEYADQEAVERFVGGGTDTYEAGLLAKVRGTPFAVLLLDEIEKAHPRVLGSLLSLLDEGTLTDGRGDSVSAQNTVIVLTTNVGSDLYRRNPIAVNPTTSDGVESAVRRELERTFTPEFLNRMTEIVVFHSLDEAALRQIAQRELDSVARQAAASGFQVRIDPTVGAHIAHTIAGSLYAGREVQRAVRRLVVDVIADTASARGLRRLRVSVIDGAVVASDTLPRVSLAASRRAGLRRPTKSPDRRQAHIAAERLRVLRLQLAREPACEEHVHEAARALVALGHVAQEEGRPGLARKFLQAALGLWTRLTPGENCPPQLALEVASSHLGLCVLARDAAEEARHLALAMRFLGQTPARSTKAQRMWALAREALGQLGARGVPVH